MLLKRAVHAFRSPVATAFEIILPIGGVFVAMVFALAIGSTVQNDPSRTLTIPTSSEQSADLTLFYAQFGNSTGLNLNVSEITLVSSQILKNAEKNNIIIIMPRDQSCYNRASYTSLSCR